MANVSHFNIDGTVIDVTPATPPTVGNGTLTIQKNGSNVQTFTANQSSNATANIIVPTKVSELTNDSGYTTNTGTVTQVKVGTTAYNPSSGVVSLPVYPTVNNATLTIQKNGSNVQTFTANQSSNATANITMTKSDVGLSNVANYDQSKAIKSITRSGTTFTATALDGTTSTFTQQDNNTTYSASTGLSLSGTAFSVKYGNSAGTACQGNDSRLFDAGSYSTNTYTNNIINVNTSTLNLAKGTHFFNIQMKPIITTSAISAGVGTKLFTINSAPAGIKQYTIPVAILTSADVMKGFGICLIWSGGEVFFYSYVTVSVGDKIMGCSTIWYI